MKTFLENVTMISTAIIVGLIVSIVAQIFALTVKYIYAFITGENTSSFFYFVIDEVEVNTLPFFPVYLLQF